MFTATTHRLLAAVAVVALTAGCAPARPMPGATPPSPGLRRAWTWRVPDGGNAGMPGADPGGVAVTVNHEDLVLLDGTGAAVWQVRLGDLYDAAPLLAADRVVVATDQGLAAVDRATGRRLWDADLGDRGSTPVEAAGRLVATTWSDRLAAVDPVNGQTAWSVELPGQSLGPPAAAGATAVATWDDGDRGGAVAVDAATGAVRWSVPLAGDGVSGPAVVGDAGAGLVVVVAGDAAVHALDPATGAERWASALPGPGSPEVPPTGAGRGGIAVADRDGDVAVLEHATGRRLWAVAGVGAAVRGGPVALPSGAVAIPVDDGRLLVARGGRIIALVDPPGRVAGAVAQPGGHLVVATREATSTMVSASSLYP